MFNLYATVIRCDATSYNILDSRAEQALASALSLLPAGMEHLSFSTSKEPFPTGVLAQMQQLTYLELSHVMVQPTGTAADAHSRALQPLQALTRLVDLQLDLKDEVWLHAASLAGMAHLTRLQVKQCRVEPAALAGKTQLQHLGLDRCSIPGGAAGVAALLSYLPPLQQLTHLSLPASLKWSADVEEGPPAAAYSALTASSKLQLLNLAVCMLPVSAGVLPPAGVWQHILPTGRQLPHLQVLDISGITLLSATHRNPPAPPPECSRLVSCCPSLRLLNTHNLHWQYSAQLLVSLPGLSGLHTLYLSGTRCLEAVWQLTGLVRLDVSCHKFEARQSLVQLEGLTQLKQLTALKYIGWIERELQCVDLTRKVSCTDRSVA